MMVRDDPYLTTCFEINEPKLKDPMLHGGAPLKQSSLAERLRVEWEGKSGLRNKLCQVLYV